MISAQRWVLQQPFCKPVWINDSSCACFSWTSFNRTYYATSHLNFKYRRLVCCCLPFHHTFLILQASIKWWEKKSDTAEIMASTPFCRTLSIIFWLVLLGCFFPFCSSCWVCLFVCFILSSLVQVLPTLLLCTTIPQRAVLDTQLSVESFSNILSACTNYVHILQWLCFHSTPGTLTENLPSRVGCSWMSGSLSAQLHYMELVLVRTQPTTGYKLHIKLQKGKLPSEIALAIFFQSMCLLNKNIKCCYTIALKTHIFFKGSVVRQ